MWKGMDVKDITEREQRGERENKKGKCIIRKINNGACNEKGDMQKIVPDLYMEKLKGERTMKKKEIGGEKREEKDNCQ